MVDVPTNTLQHESISDSVKRIHLLGVAGTGMGSFAGLLKSRGFEVTGSDENVYPPMSDMLAKWNIGVMTPYSADNVMAAKPDLVVVGNVIRRENVEAAAVRTAGIPQVSFPAALGDLVLKKKHSIVVAGTHGKTTTSALMSHVLVSAGRDPTFLVGGVTQNYGTNFRIGDGPFAVVEGDEYDTAYFDKGPKFLHYRAQTLILTSVEFDHADIYADLKAYESSFIQLLQRMPAHGTVAVSAGWLNALEFARQSKARVLTYSSTVAADFTAARIEANTEGTQFDIVSNGLTVGRVALPMTGLHNVDNALGVYAAARAIGLEHSAIERAFANFLGVKRRQEVLGEPGGITVIDDFAHHPTAVKETIRAIAARFAGRPIWAVFEPRSNTSRRNIHQTDYALAFRDAQRIRLKTPLRTDKVPEREALNVEQLVNALNAQKLDAAAFGEVETLCADIVKNANPGDVVLVMSNGSFGGLHQRLVQGLSQRFSVARP
jgi:UDP-N-acetylmuramate: L-alanyl-gamma-D-glutamyl-meso-diaminopimelate ligase